MPGHQLVVVEITLRGLDLTRDPVQAFTWIDPVQFRAFDQRVIDHPNLRGIVATDKQGVLFRQSSPANAALDRVIVDFQPIVEDEVLQALSNAFRVYSIAVFTLPCASSLYCVSSAVIDCKIGKLCLCRLPARSIDVSPLI